MISEISTKLLFSLSKVGMPSKVSDTKVLSKKFPSSFAMSSALKRVLQSPSFIPEMAALIFLLEFM